MCGGISSGKKELGAKRIYIKDLSHWFCVSFPEQKASKNIDFIRINVVSGVFNSQNTFFKNFLMLLFLF